ncbi:hypothetical protein AVEN_179278-1 [Araneus ventricosus]|uniref:Uncharacterized protein n=1 Tax=Araneus ventricosus TaxID=182803 RepID=A0A4Y2NH09_ARAVE|nr:hypothetical protein AVEN_234183-1 [Araneus ventricosus]GBN28071.1 hypothetical protein AVEN_51398-1 [Araneus ventricosus]GBN37266.1 hypothetical protein AVEN_84885-1 [Araneus ventricosus]GBN37367.1 hypothetical protein AVEN_179278-1 [Araneus ventricosus]
MMGIQVPPPVIVRTSFGRSRPWPEDELLGLSTRAVVTVTEFRIPDATTGLGDSVFREAVPGGGIRGKIFGYGDFQEWPPRSPDLTPMDFFLCGYLKQQVYATPPPTLQDLQQRITDACANVTPAMLHRVQREVQARVHMCIVADGEKFEHRK